MDNDHITFKEFLSNTYDLSFMTEEEKQTLYEAGELYTRACIKIAVAALPVNEWIDVKPDKECVFMTASWWEDHWEYKAWEIRKVFAEDDNNVGFWYLGLFDDTGEEWGELDDLTTDLYKIIQPPTK